MDLPHFNKTRPTYHATEPYAFGRSLHVDFYSVPDGLCEDLNRCYQLLDELPDRLGMHKQSPPFLFRSPEGEYPDKAGLSGWVPLIESGISLHTLTVRRFVSLDVYTCGDLDVNSTLKFLTEFLGSADFEHAYLVRGKRYHE
jgi:S-adenosylmethionine/arginine decarboxylase-like enzyme